MFEGWGRCQYTQDQEQGGSGIWYFQKIQEPGAENCAGDELWTMGDLQLGHLSWLGFVSWG